MLMSGDGVRVVGRYDWFLLMDSSLSFVVGFAIAFLAVMFALNIIK